MLADVEIVLREFEGVLFDILRAISEEENALQSSYFFRIPQAEIDFPSPVPNKSPYMIHFTMQEALLIFGAFSRLWEANKKSTLLHAELPSLWHTLPKIISLLAIVPEIPDERKSWMKNVLAMPKEKQQAYLHCWGTRAIRVESLNDLRLGLGAVRDFIRGIGSLASRLRPLVEADLCAQSTGEGGNEDPPVLTKEAASVMCFLAQRHPVVSTLDDIESGANLSRATAHKASDELIVVHYARRPHGPKKGIAATSAGIAVAKLISKLEQT